MRAGGFTPSRPPPPSPLLLSRRTFAVALRRAPRLGVPVGGDAPDQALDLCVCVCVCVLFSLSLSLPLPPLSENTRPRALSLSPSLSRSLSLSLSLVLSFSRSLSLCLCVPRLIAMGSRGCGVGARARDVRGIMIMVRTQAAR